MAKTVGLIWAALAVGLTAGWILRKLLKENNPEEPPVYVPGPWYPEKVSFSKQTIKGKIMSTTAQVDQKFNVTWPEPLDKYGNPASVEATRVESDDPEVATGELAPEIGPYSIKATTGSKTGATILRLKADGDLGEGVKEIEGVYAVTVIGGDAVGFGEATATEPVDVDVEGEEPGEELP